MSALVSLLVVVALSMLIVRIAAVALTLTGLSKAAARFQARSAFTGTGFTTSEAEYVVNHPVRRRIVLWLMTLGNIGIVTAVSSLLLTFIETASPQERGIRLIWLAAGLSFLWILGTSDWVDKHLSRLIEGALHRWTRLEVKDYTSLLHLAGDYAVVEIRVEEGDWLADKRLADLNLNEEGVLVLGIHRSDGSYTGAPAGRTYILPDDTLILYGQGPLLQELDTRLAGAVGDLAHEEAVTAQVQMVQKTLAREGNVIDGREVEKQAFYHNGDSESDQ